MPFKKHQPDASYYLEFHTIVSKIRDQSHYHLNLIPSSLCCTNTRLTEWSVGASGQWKSHLLLCTV